MAEDEQDQLDEILVFQSIYENDGSFSSNIENRPISGTITIDIESEDGKQYELLCNGMLISLKHLTPLVMNFSLPASYPSVDPPDLSFDCIWLLPKQLTYLKDVLREKWKECRGGVVLYEWVNLLKTEALTMLDVKFPLGVSEKNVMLLSEHSIMRERELFKRGTHVCPICFCEKRGTNCVLLSSCGHVFCTECLSEFLAFHIQEGTVRGLICPEQECQDQIYPNIVKALTSEDLYERYDRLLLQNTLDTMRDVTYCPRLPCGKPVIVDGKDLVGYCHACNFAFCTKCKQTYHGLDPCKMFRPRKKAPEDDEGGSADDDDAFYSRYWKLSEEETKSVIDAWMEGDAEKREELESHYGKKMLKLIIEDHESESWIQGNTKRCPGCWAQIEKQHGCNKMHCTKCGSFFCWLCLKYLFPHNPYGHFSDPDSPCYNALFEVPPENGGHPML